jgi:hypothetical protein
MSQGLYFDPYDNFYRFIFWGILNARWYPLYEKALFFLLSQLLVVENVDLKIILGNSRIQTSFTENIERRRKCQRHRPWLIYVFTYTE